MKSMDQTQYHIDFVISDSDQKRAETLEILAEAVALLRKRVDLTLQETNGTAIMHNTLMVRCCRPNGNGNIVEILPYDGSQIKDIKVVGSTSMEIVTDSKYSQECHRIELEGKKFDIYRQPLAHKPNIRN